MRTIAFALAFALCGASIEHAPAQMPAPANSAMVPMPGQWDGGVVNYSPQPAPPMPPAQTWIAPTYDTNQYGPPVTTYTDPGWGGPPVVVPCPSGAWYPQVLPDGVIYHSYWAGVHEPRLGAVFEHISGDHSFIDATGGGRAALWRYGTADCIMPQGFEVDIEGATMLRLTLDQVRDFETADYRVGVPLTYGIDNWQFKFEVYHLSSHLGDEFIIAHPGSIADRINYVRDEAVVGASYFPVPFCRLYGEAGYAFNSDGGAEPWEFQFGTELSQPGPTGPNGEPFFAFNTHLREDVNFGGDINTQVGWLWRGNSGHTFRTGFQYFNGKSSQYQTFDHFEQQFGFGLWYDF
jgi:hypothetical protein